MRREIETDFFEPPKPRAFGHRGSAGTHPENTLESFAAAVAAGARYLELDIHLTRDGQIVVSHDHDLFAATGRHALISELDGAELDGFDAGFAFKSAAGTFPFRDRGLRIPKLAEVLNSFPDRFFIVEIKQTKPSLVRQLLEVIDCAGMRRRVLIASEHQEPLSATRRIAPDLPTNLSALEVGLFVQGMPSRMIGYQPPGDAIQIPPEYGSFKLVTAESVAAAHQVGLEMHVWTVNLQSEMESMLSMGVDGIISDYPQRLLEVVAQLRLK